MTFETLAGPQTLERWTLGRSTTVNLILSDTDGMLIVEGQKRCAPRSSLDEDILVRRRTLMDPLIWQMP